MKERKYKSGLICGRFYPYHLGHRYVIETALRFSDEVYIIVCGRKEQTIPAENRALWIEESFQEHPRRKNIHLVILDQDKLGIPDRGSQIWASTAEDLIGFRPEAVFTSETYQADYANNLGAALEIVDATRSAQTVSGTAIRERHKGYEDYLEPHVFQAIKGQELADDQLVRS